MNTPLANSVEEIISTHPFNQSPTFEGFRLAAKQLDALVEQGITTEKKYSLMTIDRAYLYQIPANTSAAK